MAHSRSLIAFVAVMSIAAISALLATIIGFGPLLLHQLGALFGPAGLAGVLFVFLALKERRRARVR